MTVSSPRRSSILAGVDEIVGRALGITEVGQTLHYQHQKAHHEIVKRPPVDGPKWIEPMYRRIVANRPGTPCRSGENWRWEKKLHIDEHNDSREKRFEKTLVRECAEWYNMIPVASGLLPDVEEGGRRIDLARCCGPGWFEFIELKVGDDTPLHAAIEILGYGLIYLFSRRYARELGYDPGNILLAANRISLKVLAPQESYSKGSLASFEKEVNRGLRVITSEDGTCELTMDFQFEQLPRDFDPTCKTGSPCEIMNRRQALYDVAEA